MKILGVIIGTIILVAILVGAFFYFQKSTEVNQNENNEQLPAKPVKEWLIEMDYPVSDGSFSTIVALPIECYKDGVRNNNIDREYIRNTADYVVNVKVNNIEIDENERTFIFEFVNFEKGELDYTPKIIEITNAYNPGIEDDSPFQKFEEGKHYKIYLEKNEGEIDFVCHIEGIEELYLY